MIVEQVLRESGSRVIALWKEPCIHFVDLYGHLVNVFPASNDDNSKNLDQPSMNKGKFEKCQFEISSDGQTNFFLNLNSV